MNVYWLGIADLVASEKDAARITWPPPGLRLLDVTAADIEAIAHRPVRLSS